MALPMNPKASCVGGGVLVLGDERMNGVGWGVPGVD
jgi:hypothetical protein